MKVLGIIPARYASSRFPGKPLIDLKGKTMIQRVYEGAQKATLLTDLIVATDHELIINEVNRFGGKVMLTQESHPSGTDRCAEVVSKLTEQYDVIINIQGDEPLVDARQLDALLSAFENPNVNIATLITTNITQEEFQNPNRIKVITNFSGKAIYFSRSAIPNFHHSKPEDATLFPILRHIGLYAYRSKTLKELTELAPCALEKVESLEQLRWLYYGYNIQTILTSIETPNIDTPEDLSKVLELIEN